MMIMMIMMFMVIIVIIVTIMIIMFLTYGGCFNMPVLQLDPVSPTREYSAEYSQQLIFLYYIQFILTTQLGIEDPRTESELREPCLEVAAVALPSFSN